MQRSLFTPITWHFARMDYTRLYSHIICFILTWINICLCSGRRQNPSSGKILAGWSLMLNAPTPGERFHTQLWCDCCEPSLYVRRSIVCSLQEKLVLNCVSMESEFFHRMSRLYRACSVRPSLINAAPCSHWTSKFIYIIEVMHMNFKLKVHSTTTRWFILCYDDFTLCIWHVKGVEANTKLSTPSIQFSKMVCHWRWSPSPR